MHTILVLDFGGQTCHLIARRIRDLGVFSRVVPGDAEPAAAAPLDEVKAIVLSGSPASVHDPQAPVPDPRLLRRGAPVLGICYGMQPLMQQGGGRVSRTHVREYGRALVEHRAESPLLAGIPARFRSWMSHGDAVERTAPGFREIARFEHGAVAAVESASAGERTPGSDRPPVYGIQFHPAIQK